MERLMLGNQINPDWFISENDPERELQMFLFLFTS